MALEMRIGSGYVLCTIAVPIRTARYRKDYFLMPQATPLTISVPEAGKRLAGLSRNASYAAAARGDFPVIRVGKLLRVPLRAFERMLDQVTAKSEVA